MLTPSDPNLLRIVTNMHRDEARRRFVRKAAPLLLGSIALGVGTFFVTRALKAPPSSLLAPGQLALGKPTPSSVPPEPSSAPSLDAAVEHVLATPQVRPSGGVPAKTVKRVFTLATLRPPFGVHLLVDGVPAGDKEQGGIVLLDEKAHSLTFACNGDMCEPRTLAIAAGEKDDTLTVELRILPARLVVDGEPSHSYGIVEQPTITVTSGVAADIPLGRGSETWTVFDRAEPSKRVVVRLKAGAQSTVALKNP